MTEKQLLVLFGLGRDRAGRFLEQEEVSLSGPGEEVRCAKNRNCLGMLRLTEGDSVIRSNSGNRSWPNFWGKGWFHLDALTVNSELTIKTNSRDKKLELTLPVNQNI